MLKSYKIIFLTSLFFRGLIFKNIYLFFRINITFSTNDILFSTNLLFKNRHRFVNCLSRCLILKIGVETFENNISQQVFFLEDPFQ
jgi:hypothetical protein